MTKSKQYHIINVELRFSQTHAKLDKCFHKLYTISYTSLALEFILQWNIRLLQIKSAIYMSR